MIALPKSLCLSLVDLFQVALLAVDNLRSIGCVACGYWLVAFCTGAVPELAGIAERHATAMAFIRMEAWNGELHAVIEIEFWLDDFERPLCCFAFDRPVENVIRNV